MQNENEQKLRDLVVKLTKPFKWRKDFLEWQKYRIWQENHQKKIINFLEKFIPDLKNKKILDLGCGMGGFLVAMQQKGYNIQGIDPNPDYCEITRLRAERYNLEANIINGYGEKMPFAENSFDFIYCNDVLEHCEDPLEVLKESRRVLKPSDQMYVTVINRFGFKDPHYHLKFINWMPRSLGELIIRLKRIQKENSLAGRQKLSNMHYFSYWQFCKMAESTGFEVQDLKKFKLLDLQEINTPRVRKIAKVLNLFKVSSLIYSLALFYFSGFNFLLKKE